MGPLCFYADYISFIEGENFRVPKSNESQQNSEKESLIANGDKVGVLFDILYHPRDTTNINQQIEYLKIPFPKFKRA